MFLPAQLLGWPVLIPGLFLIAGGRIRTQSVGSGTWTVGVLASAPTEWLATPASWVGVSMAVVGLIMLIVSAFRFDPNRLLVVTRYAPFSLAAWLFALAGFLSLWDFTGHVVDVTQSGLNWRFVAELRGAWGNHLTTGILFFLVIPTYLASFGGAGTRRSQPLAYGLEDLQRVPSTTESRAKPTKTSAKGPKIQRSSAGRAKAKADEPLGPS